MNARPFPIVLVCLLLAAAAGLYWFGARPPEPAATGVRHVPATEPAVETSPPPIAVEPAAAEGRGESPAPDSEIERRKEIDRDHMRKLRTGIFAYREKYGRYPEYLSQLVPEFVDAGTMRPAGHSDSSDAILASDHPDPGAEQPAYGYEFSNLEFRDGRTFAEIKEVQRSEWGDVVPLLRCFAYDKVINMAWGGEIYETQLNWEWDAATLDVVDRIGWGPGLDVGEMVEVQVMSPEGSPLAGAKVWADGRSYSLDLPDRPFTTDANGTVRIPVGVDLDRTALALRLEATGFTASPVRFQTGDVPAEVVLTASADAQTVGGVLVDASGAPVPDTRIFLQEAADGNAAAFNATTLAQVRTDSNGRWQAVLHPDTAASFAAIPAIPGATPIGSSGGPQVDPAKAAAGNAVVVLPDTNQSPQ